MGWKVGLYLQIIFYCLAGVNHFWHASNYQQILPPWLPLQYPVVYFTGICEIFFGLLLIPKGTRKAAAWLITLLLIGIFPANIQMMLNSLHQHSSGTWLTVARLPIQGILIWWAYLYTKKRKVRLS
jgi:uncharacterized membrane protein